MPPRNKQTSPKVKKEEAERRKRVLLAQEKVLAVKRLILSIVESMIEKKVSKKWFLENCVKLCHADYDDVVQERSIEHICGYPMCSNIIKQTLKQKYQISLATNKVYDLSERKYYCSNQCYKASKYLKAQLSPIPLYMRKEEKIKIHLLSDCDNRGSAGEEIVFHRTISKEEIEKVYTVEHISNNMHKMLNEEVKKCADSLNNLQIKEHVFNEQFVFGKKTPKKADNSLFEEKSESDSENGSDSEDDDDDEKIFPNYDNMEVLSEKQMPVPKSIKKSVLIPPLNAEASPSLVAAPVQQQLSIDFVYKVLNDWMTEATMKYLLGEKYIYGLKADRILERMTGKEPICSEKLQSLKEEYINLSLKIDNLPDDEDDEEEDFDDYVELGVLSEPKSNSVSETLNENSADKKVFKRRPKDKSKAKDKQVSFAPDVKTSVRKAADLNDLENVTIDAEVEVPKRRPKDKSKAKDKQVSFAPEVRTSAQKAADLNDLENVTIDAEVEAPEEPALKGPLSQPAFPLVDSMAQNVLRRQIVTNHLKSVYTDLLPIIGIHYADIREAIRKFVETLSLTPKNIVFKPKEWKVISLILYRILTKTVMKKFLNELQFLRLCEDSSMPINIDVVKLEKIVSDILSPDNIISIK